MDVVVVVVVVVVPALTRPRTRTLVPVRRSRAAPPRIFVLDVRSTVTSTPVHVWMLKPDADVLSMMPVAPPSAGPDRAWPSDGLGDGVGAAEAEDEDGDEVAATATPDPASTATADATPVPTIQVLFFPGENRRVRSCRLSASADSGPDAAGEWLVESLPFMMEFLSFYRQSLC
jgi:hypothetical protein